MPEDDYGERGTAAPGGVSEKPARFGGGDEARRVAQWLKGLSLLLYFATAGAVAVALLSGSGGQFLAGLFFAALFTAVGLLLRAAALALLAVVHLAEHSGT